MDQAKEVGPSSSSRIAANKPGDDAMTNEPGDEAMDQANDDGSIPLEIGTSTFQRGSDEGEESSTEESSTDDSMSTVTPAASDYQDAISEFGDRELTPKQSHFQSEGVPIPEVLPSGGFVGRNFDFHPPAPVQVLQENFSMRDQSLRSAEVTSLANETVGPDKEGEDGEASGSRDTVRLWLISAV